MSAATEMPADELISYAQNQEDIILRRIFNKPLGFYVDIGACHPVYDSVTNLFYLEGWQGINIEPQPEMFAELQRQRARDLNLNVCIGASPGSKTLFITQDLGTSTLSRELAEGYERTGRVAQHVEVQSLSLNDIWQRYVGSRQVDFLKIDVEGLEREVLASADFNVVTPSILLIEAIHPVTLQPVHEEWEPLVAEHYRLFLFDGLNRFYYRRDFPLNWEYCARPANVLDGYKTYREYLADQACQHLTEQVEADKVEQKNFTHLLAMKDAALADAAQAYHVLHECYDASQVELSRLAAAHAEKEAALADATRAYKALRERYEESQVALKRGNGMRRSV